MNKKTFKITSSEKLLQKLHQMHIDPALYEVFIEAFLLIALDYYTRMAERLNVDLETLDVQSDYAIEHVFAILEQQLPRMHSQLASQQPVHVFGDLHFHLNPQRGDAQHTYGHSFDPFIHQDEMPFFSGTKPVRGLQTRTDLSPVVDVDNLLDFQPEELSRDTRSLRDPPPQLLPLESGETKPFNTKKVFGSLALGALFLCVIIAGIWTGMWISSSKSERAAPDSIESKVTQSKKPGIRIVKSIPARRPRRKTQPAERNPAHVFKKKMPALPRKIKRTPKKRRVRRTFRAVDIAW